MSTMPVTPRQQRPLGLALQDLLAQPSLMPATPDLGVPQAPDTAQAPPHGFFKPGGMGRYLAGAIGDVLLQQGGMQPVFAPAQREQQQEAQWTRRQDSQLAQQMALEQYKRANPVDDEFTRMVRASGVDPASPQGQALFAQRIQHQTAEPDVVVTLPNGQLYIGPKSGLAQALAGGAPATTPPPKSELTPIEGGAGGNVSGGFPGY